MIFTTIDGPISGRNQDGRHLNPRFALAEDALASESLFRAHRSFLVNIHHIKEVVPWFKSSFMLKMNDKKHTEIPVSRIQTKMLRDLFNL
jgi:DNA-binding LytR/AlgR family response regulator